MVKRKDPERQRIGAVNRALGKRFEARLDATFEYYRARGFAFVEKTPEPMKVIGRLEQGRFVACYEKKAQPDYKGIIKGGRTVLFEAKFTTDGRIEQNRVLPSQADYMTQHEQLGARCYVLVGFGSGAVYRVPWSVWADMKTHFGHKYATEAELAGYRVSTAWNDTLLIF